MPMPSNVDYCTVTGRFLSAVGDGADADRLPDGVPVAGLTITFTSSLNPPVVRNAADAVTIVIDKVVCTTDANGYLLGPDGTPGVMLVASDDPDLDPHGWTWKADVAGATSFPRITTTFVAPSGGAVDLATVIPVPSSPGAQISQWQAVVTQATTARDETFAARDEVLDAAGTFIGNTVTIVGADKPRNHPTTGAALPAGTTVFWIASTTPAAMADGDQLIIPSS